MNMKLWIISTFIRETSVRETELVLFSRTLSVNWEEAKVTTQAAEVTSKDPNSSI